MRPVLTDIMREDPRDYKLDEIAAAMVGLRPLAELNGHGLTDADAPRGFARGRSASPGSTLGDFALIAEIKKAMPSKGPDPVRFRSPRMARV